MKIASAQSRWTTWLCRGAAAGLIVAWVTTRLGWVQYYVLAALYWLLEQAGWMDESKGLGGQVAGYNYWREPIWLREIANLVCQLIVTAPLLLIVLVMWERCSPRWYWKPCPACGTWNWNASVQCSSCRVHGTSASGVFPSQRWLTPAGSALMRAGAISASFSAAMLWGLHLTDLDVFLRQQVIVNIGEALGGQVMYLGRMVVGPNGPFQGSGWIDRLGNIAYLYASQLLMLSAAASLTITGARLLIMRGFVKVRTDSACHQCGYSLIGIASSKCPECGTSTISAAAAKVPDSNTV